MGTRRRKGQGESKREAVRRRLAAEPPLRFLGGRCAADIEALEIEHIRALRRHLNFRRIPANHPIRHLWSTRSSESRFRLQHLADDLQSTEGVDGFPGLVRRMLEDGEAYEDYRYELRVAANLARAGAHVTRLAGPTVGADIEFRTDRQLLCGVACYRTRSATPHAVAATKACGEISQRFLPVFGAEPIPLSVGLKNEASFAALCGVSPVDASSGRQHRHRLNRGGNRDANRALWVIAFVRARCDPRTKEYVQRRRAEGLSKPEILRCIKRYIAREVFKVLQASEVAGPATIIVEAA